MSAHASHGAVGWELRPQQTAWARVTAQSGLNTTSSLTVFKIWTFICFHYSLNSLEREGGGRDAGNSLSQI